ncbi:MAG: peptidoglycan bridge formation glycyltransferase FemA/FemB family protein [Anaerolineae bacterium]|nr:peptidoglycan bridge formation glycyltransferase FemA/FemB family protein [Anaerolineae bacterium]
MPEVSAEEWDAFFSQHPQAHYQQSSCWGELKCGYGYDKPVYVIASTAGAQILFPRLPLGIKVGYIPNGPIGNHWQELWHEVDIACRKRGAIFLKVEPDHLEPVDDQLLEEMAGFQRVVEYIQPRRNIVLDLKGNAEDWLTNMHKTTRKNIRKAIKTGLILSESEDIPTFQKLVACTAKRRRFKPRDINYFQKLYNSCICKDRPKNCSLQGTLLIVSYQGTPLSGKIVLANGSRAWAVYTGTCEEQFDFKQNYLVYFEGMRWAASKGCLSYDLGGIPDYDEAYLEANAWRTEGTWGLYRFKRGFGGKIVRSVGAWDRVYNPLMYLLYRLYIRASGRYREDHI